MTTLPQTQQFHQLCAEKFFQLPEILMNALDDATTKALWKIHQWLEHSGKNYHDIRNRTDNPDKWIPDDLDAEAQEDYESFLNTKWIYNSYDDWSKLLKLKVGTVRRVFKILRNLNLIHLAQFGKSGINGRFDRRYWVAINYENLCKFLNAETLAAFDVQENSRRDEQNCTSSYISKDNYSKNNEREYNNSDDVLTHTSEIDIDLNTQDQKQPQDSRVVEKPKLKSQVKTTIPHEDQSCGAARHDTTSPDAEVNNKLVEGLGVILNPKLKRFLASVTAEEILKAIAAYYYTLEIKQTNVENVPGFVIDATKNYYLENTSTWTQSTEQNQNLMLLAAGLMALGAKLENGFYGVAVTGEIVFVDKTGERQAFDSARINQIVLETGIVEALKVAWKTYLDVAA